MMATAVARNAQSLVVLMVLLFSLFPPLLFRKSRMPFAVHLAFSLHFHAFRLLLISIALLIPVIDLWLGGRGLASQSLDNGIAIGSLLICAVYLYVAAGTVLWRPRSNPDIKNSTACSRRRQYFPGLPLHAAIGHVVHDLKSRFPTAGCGA